MLGYDVDTVAEQFFSQISGFLVPGVKDKCYEVVRNFCGRMKEQRADLEEDYEILKAKMDSALTYPREHEIITDFLGENGDCTDCKFCSDDDQVCGDCADRKNRPDASVEDLDIELNSMWRERQLFLYGQDDNLEQKFQTLYRDDLYSDSCRQTQEEKTATFLNKKLVRLALQPGICEIDIRTTKKTKMSDEDSPGSSPRPFSNGFSGETEIPPEEMADDVEREISLGLGIPVGLEQPSDFSISDSKPFSVGEISPDLRDRILQYSRLDPVYSYPRLDPVVMHA